MHDLLVIKEYVKVKIFVFYLRLTKKKTGLFKV